MRAIETQYRGYRFRSRLEARWAVFFDCMGIVWEYELEGFQDERLRYLPDFWLPQVNMWAEVKYRELNEEEIKKAKKLVEFRSHPVLMLVGPPDYINYYAIELDPWNDEPTDAVTGWDYSLVSDFLHEKRFPCCNFSQSGNPDTYGYLYALAVDTSRRARFEYGDNPTGLVNDAILLSGLHGKAARIVFDSITR